MRHHLPGFNGRQGRDRCRWLIKHCIGALDVVHVCRASKVAVVGLERGGDEHFGARGSARRIALGMTLRQIYGQADTDTNRRGHAGQQGSIGVIHLPVAPHTYTRSQHGPGQGNGRIAGPSRLVLHQLRLNLQLHIRRHNRQDDAPIQQTHAQKTQKALIEAGAIRHLDINGVLPRRPSNDFFRYARSHVIGEHAPVVHGTRLLLAGGRVVVSTRHIQGTAANQ